MSQRCAAVTTLGNPCHNYATEGREHCWSHDPEKVASRQRQKRALVGELLDALRMCRENPVAPATRAAVEGAIKRAEREVE